MTALQPVLSNSREALKDLIRSTQSTQRAASSQRLLSRKAPRSHSSFRENQATHQGLLNQYIPRRCICCWHDNSTSAMHTDRAEYAAATAAIDSTRPGEDTEIEAAAAAQALQERHLQVIPSQQQKQQRLTCVRMQQQDKKECTEFKAEHEQLPQQPQQQGCIDLQDSELERVDAAAKVQQSEAGRQQQQQQEAALQGRHERQHKPQKPKPTHFVAMQVSHSQQVCSAIASVQAMLGEAAPHLVPCLLEPITAHLTIMVLHLANKAQEDAAAVALADLAAVLQGQQLLAPLTVQLKGLSSFRHQVLYLDVAGGPGKDTLKQVAQCVISHFASAADGALAIEEGRSFTPHVTVAKTSRLIGKHRKGPAGHTKIPAEMWAAAADVDAGSVTIHEIQICSMQGRKAGGYYRVIHKLHLSPPGEAVTTTAPAATTAEAVPVRSAATAAVVGAKTAKRKLCSVAAARKRFRKLLLVLGCASRSDYADIVSGKP